jgi:hypothetical protein
LSNKFCGSFKKKRFLSIIVEIDTLILYKVMYLPEWLKWMYRIYCIIFLGPSWLYGSWINKYLCNQCLSPLTLWAPIPLRQGVLNTTLCEKNCQWFAEGQWFSLSTPVSSTNKTDHHHITGILLMQVFLMHNILIYEIAKSEKKKLWKKRFKQRW